MKKPTALRAILEGSVPELKRNPNRLLVFIDGGVVRSTAVRGLSFVYAYTLNMIITDFSGDEDAIMVPIIAWLRTNQPDLFLNQKSQDEGISFEADIINSTSIDLSIKIKLTESVKVALEEKASSPGDWLATIEHLDEPPMAGTRLDIKNWDLVIDGKVVSTWSAPSTLFTD